MTNEPTDNKISDPVITPSGIVLLYADQFAETKKITGKKWLIVLCFCTAIIGLMICVFEIRAMYLVNKYVSLPYVIGSIHALHSDRIYKKYGIRYKVTVSYSYKPEGSDSMSANNIYFNSAKNDDYFAFQKRKFEREFQIGKHIPVYHNNEYPKKVFLVKDISELTYMLALTGYLLFVISGFIFIKQIKLNHQK